MKTLTEYILIRIEPTLHDFELDGYDKTIEHFKRQLKIIIEDYQKTCESCKHKFDCARKVRFENLSNVVYKERVIKYCSAYEEKEK